MLDIQDKLAGEERTPFTNVFLQEIERMDVLLEIMKRELFELDLGTPRLSLSFTIARSLAYSLSALSTCQLVNFPTHALSTLSTDSLTCAQQHRPEGRPHHLGRDGQHDGRALLREDPALLGEEILPDPALTRALGARRAAALQPAGRLDRRCTALPCRAVPPRAHYCRVSTPQWSIRRPWV